jgi:hypothetical protein
MITNIIENERAVSYGSISCEEDLILEPKININPLPQDGRCDCCGKHISTLKPYGKVGDSPFCYFRGALLVKEARPAYAYDENDGKAWDYVKKLMKSERQADHDELDWLSQIFGKEIGKRYYFLMLAYLQTRSSWEFRDCAILDEGEYFKKRQEEY